MGSAASGDSTQSARALAIEPLKAEIKSLQVVVASAEPDAPRPAHTRLEG